MEPDRSGGGAADEEQEPWVLAHGWAVLVAGIAATILVVVVGTTFAPRWKVFEPDTSEEALIISRQEAVAEGAIKLATGIGAATAGVLAWGRLQLSRRDHRLAQAQHLATVSAARSQERIAEMGQVTDRYTRAIEQLAGSDDVALGGIYALEKLGTDSPIDRGTITEVLSAYVRRHSLGRDRMVEHEGDEVEYIVSLSEPSRAALTVLARTRWQPAALRNADLREVVMSGENFEGFNLSGTRLNRTDLSHARLAGARLEGSNLEQANLTEADLQKADLSKATLSYAYLERANLAGASAEQCVLLQAHMAESKCAGANFRWAQMPAAHLTGADLGGADLWGVNLRGADLAGANLAGADLTGSDLSEANLTGADLTETKLEMARLDGAVGVTRSAHSLIAAADEAAAAAAHDAGGDFGPPMSPATEPRSADPRHPVVGHGDPLGDS